MAARRSTSQSKAVKPTALEYDATKTTGRRRQPSTTIAAEHVILPEGKRTKLLATAQDQVRNASIAAWMIRRSLDYVSKFKFQFRTGKEELDLLINRLFDWHARPTNFDIAERFGREEMFRMFECEKTLAGDAGMIKLAQKKLQAIESDMMAFPRIGKYNATLKKYAGVPSNITGLVQKDTGVVMDPSAPGRIKQFCICNRGHDGSHVSYDHLEDSENLIFDGYFTRFSSQVRGVSPLSTAINTIQDIYEGVDFNLAKAKVHALFGIALMRDYAGAGTDQEEVLDLGGASGVSAGTDENLAATTANTYGTKQLSTSLQQIKPSEMMLLDMDTKGRIDTIESKTPSTEFREFTGLVIRLALLALDIPYTAYDSSGASFAGMIADQNLYEVSCKSKREKNGWKRREYSDWVLGLFYDDPEWNISKVAASNGFKTLRDLQEAIEWVPSGFPWLQKLNEVQGDIKAISVGLDNPIDCCKRRGVDFFQNILKTEQAYEFAKAHNVPLMVGESGQATIEEVDAENTPSEKTGDNNE